MNNEFAGFIDPDEKATMLIDEYDGSKTDALKECDQLLAVNRLASSFDHRYWKAVRAAVVRS